MTLNWAPLQKELSEWSRAGKVLPLWWRDDDAISPNAALDRLTSLAARHKIPVHLAIIPKAATPELAEFVAQTPWLIPVVHGWAHQNHAPAPEKKAEFGDHRPIADMLTETLLAQTTLKTLFGPTLCPVFVPPWNRITPDMAAVLAGQGYRALSTFTPRLAEMAARGLVQINTHLDPINWKGGRGLLAPDLLIAQLVSQLQDRRMGWADNDEPFGILTHHLVHDADIWGFCDGLLSQLLSGPIRVWTLNDLGPKGQ